MVKPEVRIIAWDDCAFGFNDKSVMIIGAVFRGGKFIDGLVSATIEKDGTDATDRISESVRASRHYDQLSLIMLNGISFAGFNMADMQMIHEKTGLPVIAVTRRRHDVRKFLAAMKRLGNYDRRRSCVKRAGKIYKHEKLFYQKCGIGTGECKEIFKITCVQSNIPEPLRVAHLIASGLSRRDNRTGVYESRGRA